MIFAGRVLARPEPGILVMHDGRRSVRVSVSNDDLAPGDLVRIDAESLPDGTLVARRCERVFRPAQPPFGRASETHAFLSEGRIALLEARARIIASIRSHFAAQQSLEIETPTVVSSPGLDVHLDAFEVIRPALSRRDPDESGRRSSIPPSDCRWAIS